MKFGLDKLCELGRSLANGAKTSDSVGVIAHVAAVKLEKHIRAAATEKIAELRERIRVLEAELEAIKITRNSYQTENGQLKKQVAMLQKKLKAAGL